MPLCPVCFQPECVESDGAERPPPSSHSTRLQPGERDYRGYIDWAVHPDEARFVLHRGYAIVNGEQRHVYFDHNEAFVTQIQVVGSGCEPYTPGGLAWDNRSADSGDGQVPAVHDLAGGN